MMRQLHGIVWCGLVLLAWPAAPAAADKYIWKDGKWVPATQPAAGTPEGELAAIRAHLEQRNYKQARQAAESFLAKRPDSPGREEAMLLAGQAELDDERYYQAFEWFEKQIAAFPNGEFLERALTREMEVANAFLAGKKRIVAKVFRLPAKDEGLTILRKIAEHAPGSLIAEKALLRIGEYHQEQREYSEAAAAYDHYLELFARSPRAPQAMEAAARTTYESFKGVPYDETPLIEAEQRYKVLLDQYPAVAKRARAQQILAEISEIRAQRAFETGKFYRRTGRPEAAQFYFRRVAEEYPSSVWAGEARAELKGQPAGPPPQIPQPPQTQPAEKAAGGEAKPATRPAGAGGAGATDPGPAKGTKP